MINIMYLYTYTIKVNNLKFYNLQNWVGIDHCYKK